MKDENKPMPPGMQQFLKDLHTKVINPGTAAASIYCEQCKTEIWLNDMHVLTYPDAPMYTTKALCITCMTSEATRLNIPLKK